MALRRPMMRAKQEPTIALINVVFLMLIFFMVSGSLAAPMDDRVALVDTASLEGRAPPDALVILPNAEMTWRGVSVDIIGAAGHAVDEGEGPALRIVPDRALVASELMRIVAGLADAGVEQVFLVTERGLE